MKELKINYPYKEKHRQCELCGHKWSLVFNAVTNPDWNPPYKCPVCAGIYPERPYYEKLQ